MVTENDRDLKKIMCCFPHYSPKSEIYKFHLQSKILPPMFRVWHLLILPCQPLLFLANYFSVRCSNKLENSTCLIYPTFRAWSVKGNTDVTFTSRPQVVHKNIPNRKVEGWNLVNDQKKKHFFVWMGIFAGL